MTDSCDFPKSTSSRRIRYQMRKLNMMKFYRDSLERRLSAMNASISTLESQIERSTD